MSTVRCDSNQHYGTLERRLVVSFCDQSHYCNQPCYPTARFRPTSSYTVFVKLVCSQPG